MDKRLKFKIMAKAPVHKLGQMIGEFIEKYFENELKIICQDRNLYLDVVGKNRPARKGKKVSWYDVYGNKHDLDFVIERDGTEDDIGTPVAIIECAWRRYTKHSKNKAQEIQGAVLPIAEKYKYEKPFLGAIIAGVYTAPSIHQLNSCGFTTVYFKYEDIITAFKTEGVDVFYGEDTSDENALSTVNMLEKLTTKQFINVFKKIVELSQDEVDNFKSHLIKALDRNISNIIISPLYGFNKIFNNLHNALDYLNNIDINHLPEEITFQKFSIIITYSNGDKISGEFNGTENALSFLQSIS